MSWIDWLQQHELPCPNKYFFGVDCPGCGMQRSFIELLRGNFLESLKMYPGLIPVILTLLFLAIHLRYRFTNGGTILKYAYITSTAIIMTSFIVRMVTHQHI